MRGWACRLGTGRPPRDHALFGRDNEIAAAAAAHTVDPDWWQRAFSGLVDRIAPLFAWYEPLRHAAALVLGMLSTLDRKNCWTIAEFRGYASPRVLQHLLARVKWDVDQARDVLRGYVVEAFADPDAVLVVDETGDLKKGTHSVGVQRQYTGTAGRIENPGRGVPHLCDAARAGAHRPGAVPAPVLGRRRRFGRRRVRHQARPGWGDDRTGGGRRDTGELGGRRRRCTAPTRSCAERVGGSAWATCSRSRPTKGCPPRPGRCTWTPLPALIPAHVWQRLSGAAGSKGERLYSWAWVTLLPEDTDDHGWHHLLIRRNDSTGELADLRCYTPRPVPLRTLVRVAGQR